MHFEDLSPYTYCLPKNPPNGVDLGVLTNALNIGWLENGCPYPKGATSWRFRWKLRRMARNLKHQMEGWHDCDICDARPFKHFGNGEVHVTGLDGTMYVAPELIVHYISKHKYLPPKEFVDAVLSSGG